MSWSHKGFNSLEKIMIVVLKRLKLSVASLASQYEAASARVR
jgi:hypothetical protein